MAPDAVAKSGLVIIDHVPLKVRIAVGEGLVLANLFDGRSISPSGSFCQSGICRPVCDNPPADSGNVPAIVISCVPKTRSGRTGDEVRRVRDAISARRNAGLDE